MSGPMSEFATPSPTQSTMGRNSPPRIFSGGQVDAQRIPAVLFHPGQPHQPSTPESESQDAKRRRIARACDMCRKKKIKCDGKLPSCTHCTNYKTECVFTLVEKKRNPPKGAKYIEGLENRLGRMESLLKLSGLLPEDPDGKTDLGDIERRLAEQNQLRRSESRRSMAGRSSSESVQDATPGSIGLTSTANSPVSPRKEDDEVTDLSDLMCSLVTNNCGETKFIGSSSGFSIFSPKGVQWVNEKTGDNSFEKMIQASASHEAKTPVRKDIFTQLFDHRIKNPLPPKEVGKVLVKDFFYNFNNLFPLFHQPTFWYLFEKQYEKPYTENHCTNTGWYASFNMVLSISCRLWISNPGAPSPEVAAWVGPERTWQYFQNAAGVLPELLLKSADLLTVQAILAMALFLQGTENPHPSWFLIGAAVRIANSIGMHRRGNHFGFNPVELEQRRRVFWIMYLLDKETALRSGRPGAINDDDVNVELPEEDPADGVGVIPLKSGKRVNLFRLLSQFSQIEGKVYMLLYSAKASRQSDQELLNTIGELDTELQQWKEIVPIEIRPEETIDIEPGPLVLHVVMLHFAYYNCLTTIHRMSVHHGYWTSRLSNYAISGLNARPLNPRVFSSAALCVSAARASIHLIKYINKQDCPCIWLIMYYPVSALVTLFANILQNPTDANARTDLVLMHAVCDFLLLIGAEEDRTSVGRMVALCREFDRIANVVLERAEKGARRKRKQNNDKQPDHTRAATAKESVPLGTALEENHSESARSRANTAFTCMSDSPSVSSTPNSTVSDGPSLTHGTPSTASAHSSLNQVITPSSNNLPRNQTTATITPTNQPQPPSFSNDMDLTPTPSSKHGPTSFMQQDGYEDFAPPPSGFTSWLNSENVNVPTTNDIPSATSQSAQTMTPSAMFGAFQPNSPDPAIYGGGPPLGMSGNTFLQPFVPQDLWQMPMTFDWDWADITMGGSGTWGTGAGGEGEGGV